MSRRIHSRLRPMAMAGLYSLCVFLAATSHAGEQAALFDTDGYRIDEFRSPVPDSVPGARTLGTEEVRRLTESAGGALVLIDVMPAPQRPKGHAKDSLWFPPTRSHIPSSTWLPNVGYGRLSDGLDSYFRANLERLTEADPTRPIVVYCLADCWMSWNAARRAAEYGYTRVMWYPEGTSGWEEAGLPLAEGTPVPMEEKTRSGTVFVPDVFAEGALFQLRGDRPGQFPYPLLDDPRARAQEGDRPFPVVEDSLFELDALSQLLQLAARGIGRIRFQLHHPRQICVQGLCPPLLVPRIAQDAGVELASVGVEDFQYAGEEQGEPVVPLRWRLCGRIGLDQRLVLRPVGAARGKPLHQWRDLCIRAPSFRQPIHTWTVPDHGGGYLGHQRLLARPVRVVGVNGECGHRGQSDQEREGRGA